MLTTCTARNIITNVHINTLTVPVLMLSDLKEMTTNSLAANPKTTNAIMDKNMKMRYAIYTLQAFR